MSLPPERGRQMETANIYTLLGLEQEDREAKAKIDAIVELTTSRLLNLLGGAEEIPSGLEYIVTEVSVMRYNRIGSEGTSSHSVEGETMSWDKSSDFDAYADDIAAYLQGTSKQGKLRFI